VGEMQPTMTKSELIELISNKIKLPKGKAEQIVNCIFDSMVDALKKGEGIEIRGFGSFTVREYKSYEGRNPRTGTPVHVAPKRLPFFKVGKELRERVNQSKSNNHQQHGGSAAAGG
jgi:integration host factor subunit beta